MSKSVKFTLMAILVSWQLPALAQTDRFIHFMEISYGGAMKNGPVDNVQGGEIFEGQDALVARVKVTECSLASPNDCIVHDVDPKDLNWSFEYSGTGAIENGNWFCIETELSQNEKSQAGLVDCPSSGSTYSMLAYINNKAWGSRGAIHIYDSSTEIGANTRVTIRAQITPQTPGLESFIGYKGSYQLKIKNRFDPFLEASDSQFSEFGSPFISIRFSPGQSGDYNGGLYVSSCSAQSSSGESLWFVEGNKLTPATAEINRIRFNRDDLRKIRSGGALKMTCVVTDRSANFQRTLIYTETKH